MTTPYASGRHSLGICDRCGQQRKLTELRYQILNQQNTNWLVCSECWEEDQPQYQIGKYPITDPQALQTPRPDPLNDRTLGQLLLENGGGLLAEGEPKNYILLSNPTDLISH